MFHRLTLLYNPVEWIMNFFFCPRWLFIILLKFNDSFRIPLHSYPLHLCPLINFCFLSTSLRFYISLFCLPLPSEELNIWLPWRSHMNLKNYEKKNYLWYNFILNATVIEMNLNIWHNSKVGADFIWINESFGKRIM